MSFTNVTDTSINSSGDFSSDIELVEKIVQESGPIVGADVIDAICQLKGQNTDISTSSRLTDCWKLRGSIKKNGKKSLAKTTGKEGYEWVFVPNELKLRLQARLEYWQDSQARHAKEIEKANQILDRDAAQIRIYQHKLATIGD